MVTEATAKRKVTALLIQKLGDHGSSSYTVFWQDERGREHCYRTTSDDFFAIQEQAGTPAYTEPGYWTYEVSQ